MAKELIGEWLAILGAKLPLGVGLLLLALALVWAERRLAREGGAIARWGGRAFLLGAVAFGLHKAWSMVWLADDAFISFRYARNFARGWGLVFNEGEWVEGYTNFLWTFLLGVLAKLGFDIPLTALFGNLLCFVLALVAVAAAVRRVAPDGASVPFAAWALALSTPFAAFGTSGLETMPVACCVALAMWGSTARHGALLAGLALTAGILLRPDQALLWGCMGLALVGEDLWARRELPFLRRLDFRRYLAYAAPFLLIYVPYFFIRWRAYGDLFPNTFYAKSGSATYLSQGWFYLLHFLVTSGGWLFVALFVVLLWGPVRSRNELRLRLFAVLATLIFGGYVVRVGGDFMEHRFFIPLMPVLAVSLEVALRWRLREAAASRLRYAWAGAAALSLAVAGMPIQPIRPFEIRWGLAAEHTFYRVKRLSPLKMHSGLQRDGKWMHRAFVRRGLSPKFAVGSLGMLGYYSDLPMVDAFGLVNRRIAHKEVSRRSRPGHEKGATPRELMEEGAILDLASTYQGKWRQATAARVDGRDVFFFRYDPDTVAAMSRFPEIRMPDPERHIRSLVESGDRPQVLEALAFYEEFLEGHPSRAAWTSELRRRLAEVADFEGTLPGGASLAGDALRMVSQPRSRLATGRSWLSSRDRGGKGELRIPVDLRPGELRFVLGGSPSSEVGVALYHGDRLIREASPKGEALAPVVWSVEEEGEGSLRIYDRDPDPAVFIEVDGIHWAAERGDLRQRVAAYLDGGAGALGPLLREAEMLLPPDDPDRRALARRVETRFDFEKKLKGLEVEGPAFERLRMRGPSWGQQAIHWMQGRHLLNSYQPNDASQGTLRFPARTLQGEIFHFLVGGGRDCARLYVGLEVDGEIVARSCGMNDEVLRPASIDTSPWAGREGRLVVVDASSGGWGHILVDDVIVERPPSVD